MTSTREWIRATYWLETPLPLEQAAAALAGEQSTGTFVAVPGETDELRERHAARVEQVEPLESVPEPSLPGALPAGPDGYHRGHVTLAWPLENVGANLPTLVATVAGNLFELREHSGLKLLRLDVPPSLARVCPRPQFGVAGTRRLTGVAERPLIGTIIKPSVGLAPEATADLVRTLAEADIDFVKDDELMADPPHAPFDQRVAAVMRAVNEVAQRTGRKVMVAFNVSAYTDTMRRHHDTVVAHGGTCVMVSLNSVGLSGVETLRRHSQLPIHGHRNGWGLYTRHPALGLDFAAYQVLWRLAGVDHLHVNGLRNKFWEPDDSVVASIQHLRSPLLSADDCPLPVVASGQWGGQAPDTYRRSQTADLLYLAGGVVMAHPDGPAAGVTALREAWEAAVQGVTLEQYGATHPALAAQVGKFGGRKP